MTGRELIRLDAVSLCYRLARQRIPSLKEYAIHWIKGALEYEELWALDDVSLSIREGETVAIVGRNGAGKSTLLKVISKVLKPTRGRLVVTGRVSPILELGTGFDLELTGRENIFLNALLLGFSRREVESRVDEIIEFSGLHDFIRSPIRTYSSGMLARLGFAVATGWRPDVLILDEVLAVGDARFQGRCEERLREFRKAGTALLLVSHDAAAVRANCSRAIWLERGELRADGPVDDVIERYSRFSSGDQAAEPAADRTSAAAGAHSEPE